MFATHFSSDVWQEGSEELALPKEMLPDTDDVANIISISLTISFYGYIIIRNILNHHEFHFCLHETKLAVHHCVHD